MERPTSFLNQLLLKEKQMPKPETFSLTINGMTADQCLAFLKKVEGVGLNFLWHLHSPLASTATQNVRLELTESLQSARQKFSAAVN
jgi:hypothetical protein